MLALSGHLLLFQTKLVPLAWQMLEFRRQPRPLVRLDLLGSCKAALGRPLISGPVRPVFERSLRQLPTKHGWPLMAGHSWAHGAQNQALRAKPRACKPTSGRSQHGLWQTQHRIRLWLEPQRFHLRFLGRSDLR